MLSGILTRELHKLLDILKQSMGIAQDTYALWQQEVDADIAMAAQRTQSLDL